MHENHYYEIHLLVTRKEYFLLLICVNYYKYLFSTRSINLLSFYFNNFHLNNLNNLFFVTRLFSYRVICN